jgi:outer membrane immunogenic protein
MSPFCFSQGYNSDHNSGSDYMHKLAFALLAATSLAGATAASAADLPARMPVKAAPYVQAPLFTWTGFYIGGNVGYGWSSGDGTFTIGGVTGPYSGSGDGVVGGVQAGYNWQSGPWVFGIETDFQGSGGSGGVNGVAGPSLVTATGKTPWFGTIRGRLGYAWDRTMIYATGGGLYGKSTLDGVDSVNGPFSTSDTYWTYTVGGGIETALWDRWSAKVEYLYAGTPDRPAVPPAASAVSGSSDTHIVRVGLNYHF